MAKAKKWRLNLESSLALPTVFGARSCKHLQKLFRPQICQFFSFQDSFFLQTIFPANSKLHNIPNNIEPLTLVKRGAVSSRNIYTSKIFHGRKRGKKTSEIPPESSSAGQRWFCVMKMLHKGPLRSRRRKINVS